MRNDKEKLAFGQRLCEALDDKKVPKRSRAGTLRKVTGVTSQEAARKWINGMSIPSKGNLAVLAGWLGCREEWLEYGVSPKRAVHPDDSEVERLLGEVRERLLGLDQAKRDRLMDALRLLSE